MICSTLDVGMVSFLRHRNLKRLCARRWQGCPIAEKNLSLDLIGTESRRSCKGSSLCRSDFARARAGRRERGHIASWRSGMTRRKDGKLAVVSFRGTDVKDSSNLVFDVDLELVKWEGAGRVHEGFLSALEEVREDLESAIESVRPCRLVYTGHSLGAAMATLMAGLHRPDALYTFGSPLVGDSDFVAGLQGLTNYRYVDCCDLVARVPPEELGYRHLGVPHYIKRNRKVTINPSERIDFLGPRLGCRDVCGAIRLPRRATKGCVSWPTTLRSIMFGRSKGRRKGWLRASERLSQYYVILSEQLLRERSSCGVEGSLLARRIRAASWRSLSNANTRLRRNAFQHSNHNRLRKGPSTTLRSLCDRNFARDDSFFLNPWS